jgi:site-specific DNA-methyltransferase (adenine-specific)
MIRAYASLAETKLKVENMTSSRKTVQIRAYLGDFLQLAEQFPNGAYDLVVADPPYFKVINESWDYKWSTLSDYMNWSESWLSLACSKLRYGGALFLFGYFRNLAPMLAVAERLGFELRQQIIIDKGMKSVAGRKTSTYKLFPNVTESVLFFIKDNKQMIKPLLKNRAVELGLSAKEINDRLGVKSNGGGMWSIYTGKNMCEQFPTKATWEKLMHVLNLSLRYEDYAQTFNPIMGLTDVWTGLDFYADNRIHPTEKPYLLIERIIRSTTNELDRILDPFGGSGITGLVANDMNRSVDICEVDERYFELATNRLRQTLIDVECIR